VIGVTAGALRYFLHRWNNVVNRQVLAMLRAHHLRRSRP
jgi:hypothetical protein